MRIERYHQRQAGRLAAFYDAAQRDLKLFAFILLTLCIYRAYFMFYMAGYMMPATTLDDIVLALVTGARLSLKTAGIVTLIGFVLATLPLLVSPRLSSRLRQLRLAWGTLAAFAFAVLFQARFPFYRQYQTGFHMQVTAGLNDDITAIFSMMVQEYGFIWRFGIALILTALSFYARAGAACSFLRRTCSCLCGALPLCAVWRELYIRARCQLGECWRDRGCVPQ